MKKYENYDLTYVTIDSLSEGVGSSQIIPLISSLSELGLKINLISYEKDEPSLKLKEHFNSIGVQWNALEFVSHGALNKIERLYSLKQAIPRTNLIHARSDIPAVSAYASNQAPVLWDVRSLWPDQKVMIQKNLGNRSLYRLYRGLENIAATKSSGMSTLTRAVVPILEQRHKRLPSLRTVVSTVVDLDRFRLIDSMPRNTRALFSGTYNDYYDLDLSSKFMDELSKSLVIDTHWARPPESNTASLGVGEIEVFPMTQFGMADLIPNYSFGVSICKLDAGPSLAAAMPTKMAEFLACGRPIVINRGLGDMDSFIEEFNAGVVLDGTLDNLQASAGKMASLLEDPETPFRCRALAEKYFNLEFGVKNYLELYSKMLS